MSSRPQLARATGYVSKTFSTESASPCESRAAAGLSCPTVLLVGRNGSWSSSILRTLEKMESELSYAVPQAVTAEFVRNGGYHLVLLDSSVTAEQRRRLTVELAGTRASIFYTFPVENGCWWLPALRRGRDCHGCPAFRRNEISEEIERVLQETV